MGLYPKFRDQRITYAAHNMMMPSGPIVDANMIVLSQKTWRFLLIEENVNGHTFYHMDCGEGNAAECETSADVETSWSVIFNNLPTDQNFQKGSFKGPRFLCLPGDYFWKFWWVPGKIQFRWWIHGSFYLFWRQYKRVPVFVPPRRPFFEILISSIGNFQ